MAETVIDGVFKLTKKLGSGSMAVVMLAEADLDKFDYTTLFAYTQVQAQTHVDRRKQAEELAETLRGKPLDPETMRTILSTQNIPIPREKVALKIATQEGYTPRFEGEWKNLLCLSHPNLVEVYGGGIYVTQPYYVMEVLENIVDPKKIKSVFSIEERIKIIIQAGKGLQFLHDNGIIHRDIKPNNLATCLMPDNIYKTKVTDLGLAKNLEENLGLTQAKMLLGSPAYMSPEQISSPAGVDHRADIYSLGVTLYELITGVYPYYEKENAYDIIMAISTQVPLESIYELVPGIPSQLAAIIETATSFDIKSRYTSVEDMVKDLETYLEHEADEIKNAIEFSEIERLECNDTLLDPAYNFTEMLKKDEPDVPVIETSFAVEGDIEALRMLVVNKKHTQFTMFKRCADKLGLICKSAQAPVEAEEIINDQQVDIAVISYEQKNTGIVKVCQLANAKNIPFIMHGDMFSKKDILYAARLGASSVMLNPIKEDPFIKKTRDILRGSGEPPPEKQRGITTILFKGKNTPPEKARMVARNVSNLLVLPHAAAKVTSLCNDPAASADKLAVPIGSDSAIAAMVLRRANSVAFGGNRKITTLRDAVVRIGRRETRQLALTVAVYKLFDRKEKSFGFNRYMYWIHALGAGLAAKILSRKIKGMHEEDAFLGGLLHDLGKIVFDDHLNEEYHLVLKRSGSEGMRMASAEMEIFAMDHSFLGARVSENWKIPQHITEAIEDHHKWKMKKGASILKIPSAAVTRIGNSIIKAMGAGHSGDFYVDDLRLAENEWSQLLGNLVAIPRICREIYKELHEFAEFLGISTSESGLDDRTRNKDRKVRIVPEGMGVLLAFFFAARGYEVLFTSWKEFSYGEDDIACDARFMPANIYQSVLDPMAYWNRHIFVVGQEIADAPEETVHCVGNAVDFFQLEQLVNEIYSEDN